MHQWRYFLHTWPIIQTCQASSSVVTPDAEGTSNNYYKQKINTTFILLSIQNFFNCLEDAVQQHCQMYGQHILFIVCHISIVFNPKIMIYLNPFRSLNLSMTSKPFRNDEISKGLFNQNIKVGLWPTDEFLWHSIYFHKILAESESVLDFAQHFVGGGWICKHW